jgi:hypothetical protein
MLRAEQQHSLREDMLRKEINNLQQVWNLKDFFYILKSERFFVLLLNFENLLLNFFIIWIAIKRLGNAKQWINAEHFKW